MIRINLLQGKAVLQPQIHLEPVKGPSLFKVILILVPVALAAVAILYFTQNKPVEPETIAEMPLPQTGPVPEKPEYTPKVVISNSVEEIVKEIESENRSQPRTSTYNDLKPAAKIEHQLLVSKMALAHIKSITSPEIGFTDLILTTPGDIYIHGMASSKENFQNFKTKFAAPSYITVKPGILKSLGQHEETVEFSLYGQLRFKSGGGQNRSVEKDQLNKNIANFKEILRGSGLEATAFNLKSVSNVGAYKRHIYQISIDDCSFGKFQNLIGKLQLAKSNTGILKFALKAAGEEKMTANIDMVLYIK